MTGKLSPCDHQARRALYLETAPCSVVYLFVTPGTDCDD
jgi:hypothetical protein